MNGSEQIAFSGLVGEVHALFRKLNSLADDLHAEMGMPAGHRAILEGLQRSGQTTVSQLAARRSVSRQHIQVIVNQLLALGVVELTDNPKHRRSPLVQLTAQGEAAFRLMRQRERNLIARLQLPICEDELVTARNTLAAIRKQLDKVAMQHGGD